MIVARFTVGRGTLVGVTLVAALAFPLSVDAQEWGTFGKTVILNRSLPPAIDLSGTRVAINVSAAAVPRSTTLIQSFRAKLIPMLFSEKTLIESPQNPERVIEVTLTEFRAAVTTDPQDKTQLASGSIKAGYRAIDSRSKQSLDSRNLAVDYDRRFPPAATSAQPRRGGVGGFIDRAARVARGTANAVGVATSSNFTALDTAPTLEELTNRLVDALAAQVAQRVVLVEESVEVPLPRGDALEKTTDLGRSGRWGAMLEQLEQMPPLAGDADAFRIYAIGVANEALAYAEENPSLRRDLIANASQQFKAALKLRPNDTVLRRAEDRIASSLAALDVTTAQAIASREASAAGSARGAGGGAGVQESRWDNAAIIELAKAGFKDSELIEAIRTAKNPAFQLESPQDLLRLRQGGVSDAVMKAMRQRMSAPRGNE